MACAPEGDDVLDGSLEEGTIVAHDDQRPRPVVQKILQRAQCVEIEVVGRLVQEQDIGPLRQHQQQIKAAPLAP